MKLSEEVMNRIIARERLARKAAEKILEERTLELFEANDQLKRLNRELELRVAAGTQDLRDSESLFRSMVESSSDIIVKATPRGICTYMNPAVTYILGYLEAEVIGRHFLHFVPDGHREEVMQFFSHQLESRENESYLEIPVRAKNGKLLWLGQKVHFTLKKGKAVNEIIAVAREITEQKLAEEMIRRSEEKYRGIIENMHQGLIEVSNDGVIREAYEGFCKMTGYQRSELEGKQISMLFPQKAAGIGPEVHKKAGKAYEMQIKTKHKGLIWVLISAAPVFNEREEKIGTIRVHMDISEQKRMQENLLQAKLLAEKSKRAEQEFLANMSHEIRTPLNSIIGITELLTDTKLDSEQQEFVDVLHHSSEILLNLISSVLDISKIEAGQWAREDVPFNLKKELEALQKTFTYRLRDRQVTVLATVDPAISNYLIGDKSWLNQVLVNLLGNAAKFTEKGQVEILARQIKSERRTRWIEFKVRDTGIGMEQDVLETIFDSFKQGNNTIGQKYGGTGLGLAICKKLVELQGGRISVKSQPGKGSVFTFIIPYEESGKKATKEAMTDESRKQENVDFNGVRILVVEDNEMNHTYISKLLDKWEVEFIIANNGKKAIEILRGEKFDMILMDVQMPEMNGYEATGKIRQMNGNARVPIIALTAGALADERKKAIGSGMNELLVKPFTPDQLQEVISRFLSGSNQKNMNKVIPMSVNKDQLEEIYGNDTNFMQLMIRKFLLNTPAYLERMRKYFDDRKWRELERIAHKCKPTFGMVGLSHLQALVEEIEEQSKQEKKDVSTSEKLLNKIMAENKKARKDLEKIINQPGR